MKPSHEPLGDPQPFPLSDDGEHTRAVSRRLSRRDPMAGPKLAEARYLDWLAQRQKPQEK